MENKPEEKGSASPVWENIKNSLKIAGVVLPLTINQAEALPGQIFNAEKIPNGNTSEPYNNVSAECAEHETFGGSENFSPDEWRLFEKYHFRSLWAEQEFIGHFAVLKDGRVITSDDGQVAGEHGGVVSGAENLIAMLKSIEGAKIGIVHQHSVQAIYGGLFQKMSHQYEDQGMTPELWKSISQKAKETIASIREGKVYASWPPSTIDIFSALHAHDYSSRVVDSNGVWTVAVDPETEKGEELLLLSNIENAANDLLIKISKPNEQQLKEYGNNALAIWKAFPQDYEQRQFEAGKPTSDRGEWKKQIESFIQYSRENGLKMTYTLFDVKK
jgi:hypothetical protein